MSEGKPKPHLSPWRQWSRRDDPKKAPPVLVRFTAEDGIVWTVWDSVFTKFKHHRRAHGDPAAKERIFVNGAGVKRGYTFKKGESRDLDPEFLGRQLREAGYIGEIPDTKNRMPW